MLNLLKKRVTTAKDSPNQEGFVVTLPTQSTANPATNNDVMRVGDGATPTLLNSQAQGRGPGPGQPSITVNFNPPLPLATTPGPGDETVELLTVSEVEEILILLIPGLLAKREVRLIMIDQEIAQINFELKGLYAKRDDILGPLNHNHKDAGITTTTTATATATTPPNVTASVPALAGAAVGTTQAQIPLMPASHPANSNKTNESYSADANTRKENAA